MDDKRSEVVGDTFCLGVGCMVKCDTCRHEKNWQALNEMPDSWRKNKQAQMRRVDETACQITSGCHYTKA
jgi:hypothetical protein